MFVLQVYYANNDENIYYNYFFLFIMYESMYILGNTFFHESKSICTQFKYMMC